LIAEVELFQVEAVSLSFGRDDLGCLIIYTCLSEENAWGRILFLHLMVVSRLVGIVLRILKLDRNLMEIKELKGISSRS
jgi:hypothetical protein